MTKVNLKSKCIWLLKYVCVCVGINLCKDKDITENGVIINEAE